MSNSKTYSFARKTTQVYAKRPLVHAHCPADEAWFVTATTLLQIACLHTDTVSRSRESWGALGAYAQGHSVQQYVIRLSGQAKTLGFWRARALYFLNRPSMPWVRLSGHAKP